MNKRFYRSSALKLSTLALLVIVGLGLRDVYLGSRSAPKGSQLAGNLEDRLAPIRAALPQGIELGYVGQEGVGQTMKQGKTPFMLTRYALVPQVVVARVDTEYVLAVMKPGKRPPPELEAREAILLGDGIWLLRQVIER